MTNPLFSYNWKQYMEYARSFNQEEIVEMFRSEHGKIKRIAQKNANYSLYNNCFTHTEEQPYDQEDKYMYLRAAYLIIFFGAKYVHYYQKRNIKHLIVFIPLELSDNKIIREFYFGK